MLELTVSMPAYNCGKYIKRTIESVLQQKGVAFELIIIDDASTDNTLEVINSFNDERIRLFRNAENKGIGFCHNKVIENSRAPFISHVDSDDIVLPGAFRKMLDKIKSSDDIGQVHCYYFTVDEKGQITREAFRNRRKYVLGNIRENMDYKEALLVKGSAFCCGLRTYKKAIFSVIGKFNEEIKCGEDYEMALRIIDKFKIKLVPEFLYAYRMHDKNITRHSFRFKKYLWWWQKTSICSQLLRSNKVMFFKKYNVYRLRAIALYRILPINVNKTLNFIKELRNIPKKTRKFIFSQITISFYNTLLDRCTWWPIGLFSHKKSKNFIKQKRIVYYLWQYPTLSETFIQREIQALRQKGLSVEIVADISGDTLNKDAESRITATTYLMPLDKKRYTKHAKLFFSSHPLKFINLFLYTVFHRYAFYKTFDEDVYVFRKAVCLAGVLKDKNATHIHSPWADKCSFISLVASRLVDIPFSVQARAHEIHRKNSSFALKEKFKDAKFIVTNTKYNESYLRPFLAKKDIKKLNVIYNGVNLEKFKPIDKTYNISSNNVIQILSVARLIEEKGLIYLLKACKKLKDMGYFFRCEIVGGSEEPLYTDYYLRLKKMYKDLNLENNVFFLGAQPFDKVLEKYRSADMFVLPCVAAKNGGKDITPNSLIEAMAMKLPVISSDMTGISEIVEDGISGLLVPPKDDGTLLQAMIKLINDDTLRKELGENARRKIEKQFDIVKNVKFFIQLFNG